MSVQLTVFPQNYQGTYQSISADSYNYIANGEAYYPTLNDATVNFVNMSAYANTWQWMQIALDLTNYYGSPMNINQWYCYSNTNPGYLALGTGNLVTFPDAQITGIFTMMTNLTVGATYRYKAIIPFLASNPNSVILVPSVF